MSEPMNEKRVLHGSLRLLCQQANQLLPDSPSARIDLEVLLLFVLKKERSFLFMAPDYRLTHEERVHFGQLVERRRQGEPVAYIMGERAFWSLTLKVTPDVLIPRPETELLIERALAVCAEHAPVHAQAQKGEKGEKGEKGVRIVDVGTGSGAIALALGSELPKAQLLGVDISHDALKIAEENAQSAALSNVAFMHSDLLESVQGRFDLIVSNPPYIGEQEPHLQEGDLRFEPALALVAAQEGMAIIERLVEQALPRLVEGGRLLIEHGYEQGEKVRDCLARSGFVDIATVRDLAGHERITEGTKRD